MLSSCVAYNGSSVPVAVALAVSSYSFFVRAREGVALVLRLCVQRKVMVEIVDNVVGAVAPGSFGAQCNERDSSSTSV